MPTAPDAAHVDAKFRARIQELVDGIGAQRVCELSFVSADSLKSFLDGRTIKSQTRGRLNKLLRKQGGKALPPLVPAPEAGKNPQDGNEVDFHIPDEKEQGLTTVHVYKEPTQVAEEHEPQPRGSAPVTLATPPRVNAKMELSGPADQVKKAAASMGGSAEPVRFERGTHDPARMSAEKQLDALLKDGGTAIRVDRMRPKDIARIMDVPAPTTLGRIQRETEDKHGGGLFKVRAFPSNGEPPFEYQFQIPGAPLSEPRDESNGSNGVRFVEEQGKTDVEKIEDEIARAEAQKRKLLAEAELEEARAKIKRIKEGDAPNQGLSLEAVAKLVKDSVDSALAPLRADKDKSSLRSEITDEVRKMMDAQNQKLDALIPKQKSPEFEALESQIENLRAMIEANMGGGEPKPEVKDPLDVAERLLGFLNKAKGTESPKERSEILENALEEILLQKLRGDDAPDRSDTPRTDEDWLKASIREIGPIVKQWLADEMELRKQQGNRLTKDQEASMQERIKQAAAVVQQNLRMLPPAVVPPPAIQQAPAPKPQPATAQRAAPPPPAATPPPPPAKPAAPAIRTDRYPEAVNETLTTLIDEIGQGRPDEAEWLAIALENIEEAVLDKICEVDDAEGLYRVLAPIADAALIERVKELAKANRLVKVYVTQGISIIQNNWSKARAGEINLDAPPEDDVEGHEPPRV